MKCDVHKEPLDYFCADHYCLCCVCCGLSDGGGCHSGCRVVDVEAVDMEAVGARLGESVRELEESVAAADAFPAAELERQEDRLEASILAAKERISTAFGELRDAIERRELELLELLEHAYDVNSVTEALWGLRDIDEVAEILENAHVREESLRAKIKQGVDMDRAERKEVIALASEAARILERTHKRAQKVVDSLRCGALSFKVAFDQGVAESISTYGEVKVTGGGKLNIRCTGTTESSVELEWNIECDDEGDYCDDEGDSSFYSRLEHRVYLGEPKCGNDDKVVQKGKGWEGSCKITGLEGNTEYTFCVQLGIEGCGWGSKSRKVVVRTKDPWMWKDCPEGVFSELKYTVDPSNRRVVTKHKRDWGTVVGDTLLRQNETTSWSIKILKTRDFPTGIFVGVAPFDITQSYGSYVWNKCGWYLECFHSELCAGPPHSFRQVKYGPRRGDQQHICAGDIVGVVMDTTKGELSFSLNGVNHGVAYEGIPLDKPLVPCVLLWEGDSIELLNEKSK